jgi:AcrR family transcriptional regulator
MPPVDHETRRRRIAEATVDVIAREGLEAATIRRIAAELGGPTKLVTHYFADKQELLLWAYRALSEEGEGSVDKVIAGDPRDVIGCLMEMAAADEARVRRWRVYVAFWDRAVRDPVFAEQQRIHMGVALARIAGILRARNGERPDVEDVAWELNALVQGISVQVLLDPQRWSEARIRGALARQVERLLGPPTA